MSKSYSLNNGLSKIKISVVLAMILTLFITLSPLGVPNANADESGFIIGVESFTIENDHFEVGERFTLRAVLTRQPEYLEHLSTFFVEVETGNIIHQCNSAISCETQHRFMTEDSVTYQAVVGNREHIPYPDHISEIHYIVATSSTVTATRAQWDVSLDVDHTEFAAGSNFTLTARFNQKISTLDTPYILYFVDWTSKEMIGNCISAREQTEDGVYECSTTHRFLTGNPREYKAFIALNPPGSGYPETVEEILEQDPQAVSETITVSRMPWTIEQTEPINGQPAFRANQNIQGTSSNYKIYIVDEVFEEVLHSCSSDETCSLPTNFRFYYDSPLTAYVARSSSSGDPYFSFNLEEIQAHSNGYSLTGIDRGLPSVEENTGGQNPAQLCGHTCVADPVNAITGEYYENHSDLHIPGPGASEINFERSYGVFQRERNGALGYGWTHSYEMSLYPEEGFNTLNEAKEIKLLQENGSVITFYRDNLGQIITNERNIATLSYDEAEELYILNRKNELKNYYFDAQGKLSKIEDTNGNYVQLNYTPTGILENATSSKGSFIAFQYDEEGRVTTVTDHTGRVSSYDYSSAGDLIKVNNAKNQEYSYTYNNSHAIITFTNPLGGTTTNAYSSSTHTIRRQTEPDGSRWQFSFGSSYNTVTDPMGNQTRYYHQNGRLTQQVDDYRGDDESTTTYTYATNNAISTITDGLGNTTSITSDEYGNPLLVITPEGRTTVYTYNEKGQVLSQTRSEHVQEWEYDERGNLIKEITPSGYITSYTYNEDGTLASTTDPRGNQEGSDPEEYTTYYEYDPSGYLSSIISPSGSRQNFDTEELGKVTTIYDPRWNDNYIKATKVTYNALGEVSTIVDSNGLIREQYEYDQAGNILSHFDAKGNDENFTYDALGRMKSETNRRGLATNFELDRNGRVTNSKLPNGSERTYEYDGRGNVVKETDGEGEVTLFEYDLDNKLVKETLPGGATTSFEYSEDGLLTKKTDAAGEEVTYAYDGLGQLSTMTDEMGRTVLYEYTPEGLVSSLTFLGGEQVRNEYDASGNLVNRINEEGQEEKWTYDEDGLKTSYENIAGLVTTYQYDEAGNLTSTTKPDGTTVEAEWDENSLINQISYGNEETLSYEYDENGLVVEESNEVTTTSFSYDDAYNLVSETYEQDAFTYSYDDLNNLSSISYPSGLQTNYTYDNNGRLASIDAPTFSSPLSLTRKQWGDVSEISYPNGLVSSREYNNANRLIDMSLDTSGDELIWNENYARNADGSIAERQGTLTSNTFSYNDRGWLTSNNSNTIQYTISGKIIQLDNGLNLSVNQLGAPTFSSLDEVPVSSYSYNTLGQRISKESSGSNVQESYSWNRLEQLTGIESSETEIQYEYRADGLLTGKSTNESEQSLLWGRMYDLPVILSDDQYDYVYGEEISPLAQIDKTTGEVEYLHHDQVGSVIAKTDETGNLVNSTSFSSYGEGTPVSAFGYAGGWTDEDTGLIYYRARWYDPEVGKFISIDPLLETTQDPYGYAGNSPLSYIDPHGLFLDKIGSGLESIGKGASSLGKTIVNGVVTAKDVAVDWYEHTSLADKLSDVGAVVSAVALVGLMVNPVGAVAVTAGYASIAFAGASVAVNFANEDYGAAAWSAAGLIPSGASAFASFRFSRAFNSNKALNAKKALNLNPKADTRKRFGGKAASIRSFKKDVDKINELVAMPANFYSFSACTAAVILERNTR